MAGGHKDRQMELANTEVYQMQECFSEGNLKGRYLLITFLFPPIGKLDFQLAVSPLYYRKQLNWRAPTAGLVQCGAVHNIT